MMLPKNNRLDKNLKPAYNWTMMNKELIMFVVSTPSEVGHEVLSTFTSLDDAVAFVDGNPALTVTECKLVVGQFGMKLIPV